MYYKIGQISKMMGVSTHLLKHYEKFGLIHPVKNEESNYRYYDISQCARIIECKKYRNMGFSLQEITEIVGEDSQEISTRLEERLKTLEEEIRQLEYMKTLTRQYQSECKELEENLGEWFVEKISDSYFLKQTENVKILEQNSCQTSKANLIENVPICKSMLHMYSDLIDSEKYQYEWGIFLNQDSVELMGQNQDQQQLYAGSKYLKIEKQRMFVLYLKISVPYLNNQKLLNLIQEKYAEYCAEKVEDFFAVVVKTAIEEGTEVQYFKVYVPSKK